MSSVAQQAGVRHNQQPTCVAACKCAVVKQQTPIMTTQSGDVSMEREQQYQYHQHDMSLCNSSTESIDTVNKAIDASVNTNNNSDDPIIASDSKLKTESSGEGIATTVNQAKLSMFRAQSNTTTRLYLPIRIDGEEFKALIDTGAQISILKATLVKDGMVMKPYYGVLHGATGDVINTPGMVAIKIEVGKIRMKCELVLAEVAEEAILGMDVLARMDAVVNIASNTIRLQDQAFEMEKEERDKWRRGQPHAITEIAEVDKLMKLMTEDQAGEAILAATKEMILAYPNVFNGEKLGNTEVLQHEIHLTDPTPRKQAARPVTPLQREVIWKELDAMLESRVVERSFSPWATPIVIVKKKDGSDRFCLDFRVLNSQTRKDSYPLPRIAEILDAVGGASVFTTMDLKSGFWQIPMHEEHKAYTAFTIPGKGLFQFVKMPFGLCNATATFQRMMEMVLGELVFHGVLVYVDDIIVYGTDLDQCKERTKEVLRRLSTAKLTIAPKKCKFFATSVKVLGHLVDCKGIHTDPEKIEAVREWKTPLNKKELRGFLGLCSYYRKFVKDHAKIVAPLNTLTGENTKWEWHEEHEAAFRAMKSLLCSPNVIRPFDPAKPILLDIDASNSAVGAVLAQESEEGEHPVAFFSKCLSKAEQNYCTTRKELLGLIMSLEHFKHYVQSSPTHVRTDHSALLWLKSFKDPCPLLARWMERLANFNFTIAHRPGSKHHNADALSRRPCDAQCPHCRKKEQLQLNDDGDIMPKRVGGRHGPSNANHKQTQTNWKVSEEAKLEKVTDSIESNLSNSMHSNPIPTSDSSRADLKSNSNCSSANLKSAKVNAITEVNVSIDLSCSAMWQTEQEKDPVLRTVKQWVTTHAKPPWEEVSSTSIELQKYWEQFSILVVINDIVRRSYYEYDGSVKHQILVPFHLRKTVLKTYHDDTSHWGPKKLFSIIRSRFYWTTWQSEARKYVRECEVCNRTNIKPRQHMIMKRYGTAVPGQRLSMDILGPLPETGKGNRFILVINDHFSRWVEALPIPATNTKLIADVLIEQVFSRFGVPGELHTDQGSYFNSTLMKDICARLAIVKTRTSIYRPQGNGVTERFNRTLLNALRKSSRDIETTWDELLPIILMHYRASIHSTTGFTPACLHLGRELNLPTDVHSPPMNQSASYEEYTNGLESRLRLAADLARREMGLSWQKMQKSRLVKRKAGPIDVNKMVYAYIPSNPGRRSNKFLNHWKGPFEIEAQISPYLFKVKLPARRGVKVLHRENLHQ